MSEQADWKDGNYTRR